MGEHAQRLEPRQLPGLTSLRFMAAFLVLSFHYFPHDTAGVSLGFSGVTFFFLLSGFILSHNYQFTDFSIRRNLRKFLLARFARIYPAYLVSLLVAAPFFAAWMQKVEPGPGKLLAMASVVLAPLGLHSWVPGAACALNCPSWSISTEYFFYFAFPLLLPAVLSRPKLWALIAAGLWAFSSLALSSAWSALGDGLSLTEVDIVDGWPYIASQFVKFFPVARLPEFVAGILLFVAWTRYGGLLRTSHLVGVFALAATAMVAFEKDLPEVLLHNGLTAIAWAPLILAGATVQSGLLAWRPMVFLGKISFSLYLIHAPVMSAMRALDKRVFGNLEPAHSLEFTLVTALVAIVAAAVMFLVIEDPARKLILRGHKRVADARYAGSVT